MAVVLQRVKPALLLWCSLCTKGSTDGRGYHGDRSRFCWLSRRRCAHAKRALGSCTRGQTSCRRPHAHRAVPQWRVARPGRAVVRTWTRADVRPRRPLPKGGMAHLCPGPKRPLFTREAPHLPRGNPLVPASLDLGESGLGLPALRADGEEDSAGCFLACAQRSGPRSDDLRRLDAQESPVETHAFFDAGRRGECPCGPPRGGEFLTRALLSA